VKRNPSQFQNLSCPAGIAVQPPVGFGAALRVVSAPGPSVEGDLTHWRANALSLSLLSAITPVASTSNSIVCRSPRTTTGPPLVCVE
jgi:hypothetical protein